MMGERRVAQGALFYEFSLERHVPGDRLLRAINAAADNDDFSRGRKREIGTEAGEVGVHGALTGTTA